MLLLLLLCTGGLNDCSSSCSRVTCDPIVGGQKSLTCTAVDNNEHFNLCSSRDCPDQMLLDYTRSFVTWAVPTMMPISIQILVAVFSSHGRTDVGAAECSNNLLPHKSTIHYMPGSQFWHECTVVPMAVCQLLLIPTCKPRWHATFACKGPSNRLSRLWRSRQSTLWSTSAPPPVHFGRSLAA